MTNQNHTHEFIKGRGNVATCACGQFRGLGEPIVEKRQKHTSGPWVLGMPETETSPQHILDRAGGIVVAYVNKQRGAGEANARLIAAAPDLLAALKLMVDQDTWGDEEPDPNSPLGLAKQAIAKAEGRE